MNIIGPDSLVFGVDDVDACTQYFTDYGLEPVGDGRFEALDGTSVVIKPKDDESLPAALETGSMLRKTVAGRQCHWCRPGGGSKAENAIACGLFCARSREVRGILCRASWLHNNRPIYRCGTVHAFGRNGRRQLSDFSFHVA